MKGDDVNIAISNLIAGQASFNEALRNLSHIMLDMNNRVGALENALVQLKNQQAANPTGYKPHREAIIHRMEITGDPWEKCEEDIIRKHHERSE